MAVTESPLIMAQQWTVEKASPSLGQAIQAATQASRKNELELEAQLILTKPRRKERALVTPENTWLITPILVWICVGTPTQLEKKAFTPACLCHTILKKDSPPNRTLTPLIKASLPAAFQLNLCEIQLKLMLAKLTKILKIDLRVRVILVYLLELMQSSHLPLQDLEFNLHNHNNLRQWLEVTLQTRKNKLRGTSVLATPVPTSLSQPICN